MSATAEQKLEKRKLDALKRGIYRIGQEQTVPFSINLIGIGKAGADVVAEVLTALPPEGPMISALAVDIGDQDMTHLREVAKGLPEGRADVRTIALDVPPRDELFATLRRYREFLKMEYPRYYWNPNYEPWLPAGVTSSEPGQLLREPCRRRSTAGRTTRESGCCDGARRVRRPRSIATVPTPSWASFSVGRRHRQRDRGRDGPPPVERSLGRRAWVIGIGILPNDGDPPEHRGGAVFAALNELDCMSDQRRTRASWRSGRPRPQPVHRRRLHGRPGRRLAGDPRPRRDPRGSTGGGRPAGERQGADLVETLSRSTGCGARRRSTRRSVPVWTAQGDRWIRRCRSADQGRHRSAGELGPVGLPPSTSTRAASTTRRRRREAVGGSGSLTPAVTPELIEGGRAGPSARDARGEQARPHRVRPGPRRLRPAQLGRQAPHPLLVARPGRDAGRALDPVRRHGRRVQRGCACWGGRPPRGHPRGGGCRSRRGAVEAIPAVADASRFGTARIMATDWSTCRARYEDGALLPTMAGDRTMQVTGADDE